MDTKMIDMKRDMADEESGATAMPADATGQYPWGLQITLDDPDLDKLGIEQLPPVGTEIKGIFTGVVTATRQSADDDGSNSNMSIQMCCLNLMAEAPDKPGEKENESTEPKAAYKTMGSATAIVD